MNERLLRERIEELDNEELLALFKECNGWDGSFDFTDVWDIEELCSCCDSYEIVRAIIYGDVRNVNDNVRFNSYGNLETVDEYDLYNECEDNIDELIEWLLDNSCHIDLDYYIDVDGLEEDEEDEEDEDEEAQG